jgi:hypothetical protein
MIRRYLSVGTEPGGTNVIAPLSVDAPRAGKGSTRLPLTAMLLIIRPVADVGCGLHETFTSRKL